MLAASLLTAWLCLQYCNHKTEVDIELAACTCQVRAASVHTAIPAGNKQDSSISTSTQVQVGDPGPEKTGMTWHQSRQHQARNS